jgi:hypothetical protein
VIAVGDVVLYRYADDWLPAVVVRRHGDGSLNLFVMLDSDADYDNAGGRIHENVTLGPEPGQWRHR